MKKIAITSLTFSIISLIIVFSIYMPKFKPSTTLNSTDIYQQKNVELFPELKSNITHMMMVIFGLYIYTLY